LPIPGICKATIARTPHIQITRPWRTEDELQNLLRDTMKGVHDKCVNYGRESDDYVDYLKGANIAGFVKVADAMLAYGVI